MYRLIAILFITIADLAAALPQQLHSSYMGGGHDKWPKHLWPKVRIERWTSCGLGPGNGGQYIDTTLATADNCHNFEPKHWKGPPEDVAATMKGAIGNRTLYQKTLNHYNMSDLSNFRALYWEMPYMMHEDILKPAVRCNITVFDMPLCSGYRVVKFTNEAQDVCIPAHGGHSIRVDCYTQDELNEYAKANNMTSFPPQSWRESAIARYNPQGRWEGEGASNMQVLERVDPKKKYDKVKEPEMWARSKEGRYYVCRMLEQKWWERCEDDIMCDGLQNWSKVVC